MDVIELPKAVASSRIVFLYRRDGILGLYHTHGCNRFHRTVVLIGLQSDNNPPPSPLPYCRATTAVLKKQNRSSETERFYETEGLVLPSGALGHRLVRANHWDLQVRAYYAVVIQSLARPKRVRTCNLRL